MLKLLFGLNPMQKQKCVKKLSALSWYGCWRYAYRYANCSVFICFGESVLLLPLDTIEINCAVQFPRFYPET